MKNQTLLIVLAVALIIGGFCGFFIKSCSIPKPIPQTTTHDTLRIKADTVKIAEKHWYALPKDTNNVATNIATYPKLTISDSLQGTKEGIGYNLRVRASIDSLSVAWKWETAFVPPDKITVIDSIYVNNIVEVAKPWYSDNWFYLAAAESIAGIYVIVKVIQALIK